MQDFSALRIEMMRLLCGFAEQFSVIDLQAPQNHLTGHLGPGTRRCSGEDYD